MAVLSLASRMRTFIHLVGFCFGLLAMATPAHAVDVHGNDAQDTFTGVGGLVLFGSVDSGTRAAVANCGDCSWQASVPCDTPYGVAFIRCDSHVLGCVSGSVERRAWVRHGTGQWTDHGLFCVSTQGPVTVEQVGHSARDAFIQDLPRLQPTTGPRAGIVAQVPVLFDSGQQRGHVIGNYVVLGQRIRLTATPRWTWDFGDGARLATGAAGSRWPDRAVSHIYRRGGEHLATVQAIWRASFTVDGLGPFGVPEEVIQVAVVPVRVGEARAWLVP